METCGFALVPNAYYTFAISILITVPLTFARIYFEEAALVENLGQQYIDYQKRVPAIIPCRLIKSFLTKSQH